MHTPRFTSLLSNLILMTAALCVTGACKPQRHSEAANKPASRGLPYELVVIVQRQAYEGELADTLEHVLKGSTPVLPQHEPLFRLDVTFTDANLIPWRTFRNRLIVKIDRQKRQSAMGIARNVAARPQIEVMVTGPSAHDVACFIADNSERITDLFIDAELEWQAGHLRQKYSQHTAQALDSMTGHTICVPAKLRASKVGKHFLWTGTNLNDKDQNFVFYSYPWNGKPLNAKQYVAMRDSALKANIPGAGPTQWMQTAINPDTQQPLLLARARKINNEDVLEIHGLWEMHDGALGGAFVAIEHIDTLQGLVLATEGFIYSPYSPKRNLMREMEAALRTFH